MNRTPPAVPTHMRFAPRSYVRRRRERRMRGMRALLAVTVTLVVGWGVWAVTTRMGTGGTAGSDKASVSDPESEWRVGEVPRLYQTDPAWADEGYAGGTIAENGCGPTCLSMVYVALTGRTDLGPAEMAAFAERGGHVVDGMTAWTLMTDGAAELGLRSEELPADEGSVRAALAAGHPVICSVVPGDFTTTGHFIVLAGLAEDGTVVVRDPNSAERTAQTWGLGRVLGQCANLWAFSA